MTEYNAGAERQHMIGLAQAQGYDPQLGDEGVMQDYADQAYAAGHNEELDGPFVFPSVLLAQENAAAMKEQTEIGSSTSDDPAVALAHDPNWPAAVREEENHSDEFPEYSYCMRRWLGFLSFGDAQDYVAKVGDYLEIPGPGDGLGTYYSRTAHRNPHHKEETNG